MSRVQCASGGGKGGLQGNSDCDRDSSVRFQTLTPQCKGVTLGNDSENQKAKLTHEKTVSMLKAATSLSCNAAVYHAQSRLCELWDSGQVPVEPVPVKIVSWKSLISTIHLAREQNILYILKRIFYELLSNEQYWNVYHTKRDSIDLSSSDRERLLCARDRLGTLWREFALAPPETTHDANGVNGAGARVRGPCCYRPKDERAMWWRSMAEFDALERGALDPIRYNLVNVNRQELRNHWWCDDCVRNKEKAWKEKRVEWWQLLDDMFML